jgi:pyridoxine 4-dehydrogenase
VGIAIVAYSPLSRGWLTGQFRRYEDLAENDMRRMLPRFQPAVFDENFKLVEAVESMAKRKGATSAQVALAWVRRQGAIPIPGATTIERIVENYADVVLDEEDWEELEKILNAFPIQGERYGGKHEELLSL